MNGPQDLGGAMGFGPVVHEADEPPFHADWEKRTLALYLAMSGAGAWNTDMARHARERMPPAEYLSSSYYRIWLKGMERLLVERGLASAEEIVTGRASAPGARLPRKPDAAAARAALARGMPSTRPQTAPALFAVGDLVRAKVMNPAGHTRLPRYARGRLGRIDRIHGFHVFPDSSAHDLGDDPRWLYSVAFDAAELWGPEGRAGDEVFVDLFEPYLERA